MCEGSVGNQSAGVASRGKIHLLAEKGGHGALESGSRGSVQSQGCGRKSDSGREGSRPAGTKGGVENGMRSCFKSDSTFFLGFRKGEKREEWKGGVGKLCVMSREGKAKNGTKQ